MADVQNLNITTKKDMGAWIPTNLKDKKRKKRGRKKTKKARLTKSESEAMRHSGKLGAGARKRKKLSPKSKKKVVMEEFRRGTLHSGSGRIVKKPSQAVAIGYSEAGESRKRKKRRR